MHGVFPGKGVMWQIIFVQTRCCSWPFLNRWTLAILASKTVLLFESLHASLSATPSRRQLKRLFSETTVLFYETSELIAESVILPNFKLWLPSPAERSACFSPNETATINRQWQFQCCCYRFHEKAGLEESPCKRSRICRAVLYKRHKTCLCAWPFLAKRCRLAKQFGA